MGVEDEAGKCRETEGRRAGDSTFVYEPGRTLYMMPFTDAEEEIAWDRAIEYMQKPC